MHWHVVPHCLQCLSQCGCGAGCGADAGAGSGSDLVPCWAPLASWIGL